MKKERGGRTVKSVYGDAEDVRGCARWLSPLCNAAVERFLLTSSRIPAPYREDHRLRTGFDSVRAT